MPCIWMESVPLTRFSGRGADRDRRVDVGAVESHEPAPGLPPGRRGGRRGGVQHVGDAPAVIAAGRAGLTQVARHQLEGRSRTLLHLRHGGRRVEGALVRQHHADDRTDDHQSQNQWRPAARPA